MKPPIGIQLYSVREALVTDYAGIVRRIAGFGYVGVEPAGFPGTSPEKAGELFRQLGLAVPSAHTPLPLGDAKNEVLDAMAAIGCKRIISGKGRDSFGTIDQIKRTCGIFNEASAVARENGLTFGMHNHWWEYQKVEGRYVYEVILESVVPEVFFEIDTYWVQTAGPDPATVVREFGARAPILHLKDGPCLRGEAMVALGDGVVDIPSVVAAGEGRSEWLIVELDACATDMMEAVERSCSYLVANGLGRGS